MAVDSKNPLYIEFIQDWDQLRDTYRGERIVKERGFKYLPATSGMVEDGISTTTQRGFKAYTAYRMRARFPDFVKEAVEAMLGVMHNKPPVIELPARLETMLKKATLRNESMPALLRRINEEQLVTGRLGILLEVPDAKPKEGGPMVPLIALYQAEDIINWDEGEVETTRPDSLNLVVLDETEDERDADFEWESVDKHRVLILGDPTENENQGEGIYSVGVFRDNEEFTEELLIVPMIAGKSLDEIPFKFINTKDVVPTPDEGPLLGLSNLSLTVYRGEADYRQALFLQGQDTLVITGNSDDDEDTRVGAGATINVPIGGDAKYIGVESTGLTEQREALVNDNAEGKSKATALIESTGRSAESGSALRIRVAARTASLNQIALSGAFALEELLKIAATWVGANPDDVIVTPNLDFVADILAGQELTQIMGSKMLGAPVSLESIHELMAERGMTTKTFEEEIEQMEKEAQEGLPGSTIPETDDGATDEGSPEDDEPSGSGDD